MRPDLSSVAIAGCRLAPGGPPSELYPDPDSELVLGALVALGIGSRMVAWDDPSVDWARFRSVVIRSTWDGVDRPEEFLRWVEQVDRVTTVHNPPSIVGWNMDKTYLRDLELRGIPTIATQWVEPGGQWEVPADEFIVKPSIAGGARNTARYSSAKRAEAARHVAMLGDLGQTSLIQPFMSSIENQGEVSLIFLGGQFSHAIRKGGFLQLDEGIVDKPWERMTYLGACEASPSEREIAERTFGIAQQRAVQDLVYGRVDLINDDHGDPTVIEMELIDPYLSLAEAPRSAATLAEAIANGC